VPPSQGSRHRGNCSVHGRKTEETTKHTKGEAQWNSAVFRDSSTHQSPFCLASFLVHPSEAYCGMVFRAFGNVAKPRGPPLRFDKRGRHHSGLFRAEGTALCQPRRPSKLGTPANASSASVCATLGNLCKVKRMRDIKNQRHKRNGWTHVDRIVRSVHLYTGLFLVPWMLIYAASAFFLNHGPTFRKWLDFKPPKLEVVREVDFVPNDSFPKVPVEQAAAILRHLELEGAHRVMSAQLCHRRSVESVFKRCNFLGRGPVFSCSLRVRYQPY
jgi:hypothetical protein